VHVKGEVGAELQFVRGIVVWGVGAAGLGVDGAFSAEAVPGRVLGGGEPWGRTSVCMYVCTGIRLRTL
jgi:hypothetical protein